MLNVELPHTIDEQQLTETPSFGEKYDPKIHVRTDCRPKKLFVKGFEAIDSGIVPSIVTTAAASLRRIVDSPVVNMGMPGPL